MKTILSEIRKFVSVDLSPEVLCETLSGLGLVCNSVREVLPVPNGVVIVKVLDIGQIKGADKIRKVVVSDLNSEYEIVCGAKNFKIGDICALATVGAELPGGYVIEKRVMKGIKSNGMLVSPSEIGLGDDHSGLLVLNYIRSADLGQPLVELFGTKSDYVFDLEVEGNRPDALSTRGIARDIAAKLNLEFRDPILEKDVALNAAPTDREFKVELSDTNLSPYFSATRFNTEGANLDSQVLKTLLLLGQRLIHPVVDASNYVMFELGHPTHPYDATKIMNKTFDVRESLNGDKITTLDGRTWEFGTQNIPLVVDGANNPVGIAGIMGGSDTAVTDDTVEVVLEAAHFDPVKVLRASRDLGVSSEAALRFSRGIDQSFGLVASFRVLEILGLKNHLIGISFAGRPPYEEKTLTVNSAWLSKFLGCSVDETEAKKILNNLGFTVHGTGELSVTAPSFRPDIDTVSDIAEEVARILGYENIGKSVKLSSTPGKLSSSGKTRRLIRDILIGHGFIEALNSSFADGASGVSESELVELFNPLSQNESVLRFSLVPMLFKNIERNISRGHIQLSMFEIGKVFFKKDQLVEREHICAITSEKNPIAKLCSVLYDITQELAIKEVAVKNCSQYSESSELLDCLDSGQAMVATSTNQIFAAIGLVNKEVVFDQACLVIDFSAIETLTRGIRAYNPVERLPRANLDLSFVVPNSVSAEDLRLQIARSFDSRLRSIFLTDVYRGKELDGERSLTFRLIFFDNTTTIQDIEIQSFIECAVKAASELGARLR